VHKKGRRPSGLEPTNGDYGCKVRDSSTKKWQVYVKDNRFVALSRRWVGGLAGICLVNGMGNVSKCNVNCSARSCSSTM
jgi:hypothetical protein